ncbi:MAG: adenylate/guanylate cyclase domain-containing protein, partial [Actinobacteria bacterium]
MSSIEARVEEMSLSREQGLEVVTDLMRERMPDWDWLVAYVFHRQLLAALRRSDLWADPDRQASGTLCVGFADLVGFTALSQALDQQELAAVVSRFENLAYDTIGHLGGRVVKMIGDEVMFVADDVRVAAEIALMLAETYARDETISAVRVGLASGPVLAHEGDYFGPVVNLASRIVNIAYPGTVVAAEDVYEALQGDPAFGWKPI